MKLRKLALLILDIARRRLPLLDFCFRGGLLPPGTQYSFSWRAGSVSPAAATKVNTTRPKELLASARWRRIVGQFEQTESAFISDSATRYLSASLACVLLFTPWLGDLSVAKKITQPWNELGDFAAGYFGRTAQACW
ncbi:MAG: hypothetical protein ACREBG_12030 [Pyrinomonadaceae bacterium]